jgi:hypothetical protein
VVHQMFAAIVRNISSLQVVRPASILINHLLSKNTKRRERDFGDKLSCEVEFTGMAPADFEFLINLKNRKLRRRIPHRVAVGFQLAHVQKQVHISFNGVLQDSVMLAGKPTTVRIARSANRTRSNLKYSDTVTLRQKAQVCIQL